MCQSRHFERAFARKRESFVLSIPKWAHRSGMDGRRCMAMRIADRTIAIATAALRELGVTWICVWLERASNHRTDTSTGQLSQATRRQLIREVVAL